MDKLKAWEARIERPPRDEVANLEHLELLAECRIGVPGKILVIPPPDHLQIAKKRYNDS